MSVSKPIAPGAMALAATCGAAMAEVPGHRVFILHSTAQCRCPALDWHVAAGSTGGLSGIIARISMQSMAKATGNIANGKVTMIPTEIGGQACSATVDGTLSSPGWCTVNIIELSVSHNGIMSPTGSRRQVGVAPARRYGSSDGQQGWHQAPIGCHPNHRATSTSKR